MCMWTTLYKKCCNLHAHTDYSNLVSGPHMSADQLQSSLFWSRWRDKHGSFNRLYSYSLFDYGVESGWTPRSIAVYWDLMLKIIRRWWFIPVSYNANLNPDLILTITQHPQSQNGGVSTHLLKFVFQFLTCLYVCISDRSLAQFPFKCIR